MDSLFFFIAVLLGLAFLCLPVVVIVVYVTLRNRSTRLQQQLDRLQEELGEVRGRLAALAVTGAVTSPDQFADDAEADTEAQAPAPETGPVPAVTTPSETASRANEPAADTAPRPSTAAASMTPPGERVTGPAGYKNPVDVAENALRRVGDAVVAYFTDGNVFVRIGILVLFFGVAFLLRYAAENALIPVEFRYIGAAAGGLALLGFGWRLRRSKPVYALLLQGGGIGVLYITIFAAFRLAGLLPSTLTFALLVFFAAFTVALAILQDSRALAIYAVVGGFLAPFLASTGSGNYIGLFSYYSILNAAVFAVAWFRAWRSLNLVGFLFTFVVFVLWVAFDYREAYLYPASAFLLLFFLMYSLIGVLYGMRQPEHLAGYVDGTLVFGTPVVVSGLLMAMLHDYDYGIAGASAGMGFYYLLLARFAWKRVGEAFRLLAEALLAIGVVFATLAIPYALEGHWSSAAWALEAAGILWVSIRQQRFYAQCFAILLQVGAGVLFFLRNIDDVGDTIWLNPAFIGGVFVALGAFVSARMLYLQAGGFRLRLLHAPFFIWAIGWWLVSALVQIDAFLPRREQEIAWLLLFAGTAALLVYLDRVRGWNWRPAAISAAFLLPLLIVIALERMFVRDHLLAAPAGYFWAAALTLNYWLIARLESVDWPRWPSLALHTGFVVFVSLLLSLELVWIFNRPLGVDGDAYASLIALVPLIALQLARRARMPAIERLGAGLQYSLILSLTAVFVLWSLLANLNNSGDPAPLPYLPFLNPLDLLHIAFFVIALGCLGLLRADGSVQREHILILLAGLAFVWLTAVLIRSMHHYLQIPFDMSDMLQDTRVQTSISILWTLIGMGAMLFASKRALRPLWIAGAALVGVVLVKLFFVDLGASGTVERIVSFLVVGSLLVATGYFSPIPRRDSATPAATGDSSHG